MFESRLNLGIGARVQGVAPLWPVEGDLGNVILHLIEQAFKVSDLDHGGLPALCAL
jgi:hypothetical protein